MGRWVSGWVGGGMGGCMDRCVGQGIAGWVDESVDEWVGGVVDGCQVLYPQSRSTGRKPCCPTVTEDPGASGTLLVDWGFDLSCPLPHRMALRSK